MEGAAFILMHSIVARDAAPLHGFERAAMT